MSASRLGEAQIFALFRLALGLYFLWTSLDLLDYGWEIFAREGMLPDPALSPLAVWMPRALLDLNASQVYALLWARAALATLITVGLFRRPSAALLWLIFTWEHQRNGFVTSPEFGYVGWLLLFAAAAPTGEPWAVQRSDPTFRLPVTLRAAAWLVLAVSYSYSGLSKLGTAAWLDGTATRDAMGLAGSARGWIFEARRAVPDWVFALSTWSSLAIELSAVVVVLFRRVRAGFWAASVAMHLGILLTMSIEEVSLGMLIYHLVLLDSAWFRRDFWRRSVEANQGPGAGAALVQADKQAGAEGDRDTAQDGAQG